MKGRGGASRQKSSTYYGGINNGPLGKGISTEIYSISIFHMIKLKMIYI